MFSEMTIRSTHVPSFKVISYLKNLLVKFLVYHRGIRFFEQHQLHTDPLHHSTFLGKTTVRTEQLAELHFSFYRKVYKDRIFKRGKFKHEVFIGYGIECHFDNSFPDSLRKFNNLKFVVKQSFLMLADEKSVLHLLMDVYVSLLLNEHNKK